MTTVAEESGLSDRRSAVRVVRRLEKKGIVFAVSSKKGGRNNPTRYQFGRKKGDSPVPVSDGKGDADGMKRVTLDAKKGDSPVTRDSIRQKRETKKGALAPDFSEMEVIHRVWNAYISQIEPGPNYSFTIERRKMLAARYAEMIAHGKTGEKVLRGMVEAICAFRDDDYFMGRKKGYEGAGRKGIEEIFRTQEVFEDWCAKYYATEKDSD
jgi:hypothetical protein